MIKYKTREAALDAILDGVKVSPSECRPAILNHPIWAATTACNGRAYLDYYATQQEAISHCRFVAGREAKKGFTAALREQGRYASPYGTTYEIGSLPLGFIL